MKNISSIKELKYLDKNIELNEIIDVYSDLKHRIFPRPFERLSDISSKKDLIGVEIGVYAGDHAFSLLTNLKIKKLYLIDPYEIYDEFLNSSDGKLYNEEFLPLNLAKKEAIDKLGKFKNNTQWIFKKSLDAPSEIKEELDFIYIDGNHEYKYIKKDIENYYPLLKRGGVIGGHDFYNGYTKSHSDVINAVLEFVYTHKLQLNIEQPDWWVVKK